MGVLKVIELLANSDKSWEDAAQKGVTTAAKSVKNIKSAYVQEQSATVTGDQITQYRVNLKVTFEVGD